MAALNVTESVPSPQQVADVAGNQYLVFPLAEEAYGLNIENIREIIEYCELTEVPMVPDFIRGVLNLRGSVIPVIDLIARFGGEPATQSKKSCIVIVELHTRDGVLEMGMMVDAVNEVIEIPVADIGAAPSFGSKIRTDFIDGMGKIDEKFIVLLNINHVLSIDELSLLEEANANINESIKLGKEILHKDQDGVDSGDNDSGNNDSGNNNGA